MPINGVCIHFIDGENWETLFLHAKNAGYTSVRTVAYWHEIERVSGRYDFTKYIIIRNLARKYGITMLWVLGYGNPIYGDNLGENGQSKTKPRDVSAFVNFAKEVERNLEGPKEIWNEQDLEGFWSSPNPTDYATLARLTSRGIRSVNSSSIIYCGGLAFVDDLSYLRVLADTRVFVDGTFDALAIHTYKQGYNVDCAVGMRIENIRNIVGNSVKIFITEIGYKRKWVPPVADAVAETLISPVLSQEPWRGWTADIQVPLTKSVLDHLGNPDAVRITPKNNKGANIYVKGDPGNAPVLVQARFRSTRGNIAIGIGVDTNQCVWGMFNEVWSEPFAALIIPTKRDRRFFTRSESDVPYEMAYAYSYSRPDFLPIMGAQLDRAWEKLRTSTTRVANQYGIDGIYWYTLNDVEESVIANKAGSFGIV